MHITSLEFKGEFPPLEDIEFEFNPGANVFVGSNGTGKNDSAEMYIRANVSNIVANWASNTGDLVHMLSADWP